MQYYFYLQIQIFKKTMNKIGEDSDVGLVGMAGG